MKKMTGLLFVPLTAALMACGPQKTETTTTDTTTVTTDAATTDTATTDTAATGTTDAATTTTDTAATDTTAATTTDPNDMGGDITTWDAAGQSFTFEDDGQTYTVNVTDQTTFNEEGTSLDAATFFGQDRMGQDVDVMGEVNGTTITATQIDLDK